MSNNILPDFVENRLIEIRDLVTRAVAQGGDIATSLASVLAARTTTEQARDDALVARTAAETFAGNAASAVVYQDLAAISGVTSGTAVDTFVYDTNKDSDGGAWRKRCQHLSWYNEPLGTATRGTRREFPSVAIIIAQAGDVTIYDGDDPSSPMWIKIPYLSIASVSQVTSISMKDGLLAIANNFSTSIGLHTFNFANDSGATYYITGNRALVGGIVNRPLNATHWANAFPGAYSGSRLINASVSSVAMTIEDDAPINPATGLPHPTIAVGTNGGVSIIRHSGVVNITHSGGNLVGKVGFREDGALVYSPDAISSYRFHHVFHKIPTSSVALGHNYLKGLSDEFYPIFFSPNYTGTSLPLSSNASLVTRDVANNLIGHAGQLTRLYPNPAEPTKGARAVITADYNTGVMVGDTKLAALCSTDTSSLTDASSDVDFDRSPFANPLTVNGIVTRTQVASGSELVGYGFSGGYLEGEVADILASTFVYGWEKSTTGWVFKSGTLAAPPIDGMTLTGTILKIAGTSDKALIRLSNTTPSSDQIAQIYAIEKPMFEENAQVTLYGTSSDVKAVAHDADTGLAYAGTSAGRSDFNGLVRVNNTTTAVTSSIAVGGGFVVEE